MARGARRSAGGNVHRYEKSPVVYRMPQSAKADCDEHGGREGHGGSADRRGRGRDEDRRARSLRELPRRFTGGSGGKFARKVRDCRDGQNAGRGADDGSRYVRSQNLSSDGGIRSSPGPEGAAADEAGYVHDCGGFAREIAPLAACLLELKVAFGVRPRANLNFSGSFLQMARVCEVCGKGPQFGHKISHAHNVTNRRWNVNLQTVRAIVNGAHKRLRACTSCIRSGKVQKAA